MTDLEDRLRQALCTIAADIDAPTDTGAALAAVIAEPPAPAEPLEQSVVGHRARRPVWLVAAAIAVVALGAVWTIVYRSGGQASIRTSSDRRLVSSMSKTIDGVGTIAVTVDASGMCWTPPATVVSHGGCVDDAVYESGRWWTTVASPIGTIIVGVAPPDKAVRVEVDDRTVTADADGFWWTMLPADASAFTIVTSDGRYPQQLTTTDTTPLTTNPLPSTVAAPSTAIAPTKPIVGAFVAGDDAVPDGFVPTGAITHDLPVVGDSTGNEVPLTTVVARYSPDRSTIESWMTFDAYPALSDREIIERFGDTTETGVRVNGVPLLAAGGRYLWREPKRTVAVIGSPNKPTVADVIAVAATMFPTNDDPSSRVPNLPDGWDPVEIGTQPIPPTGITWQLLYSGPDSTSADEPELNIIRFSNGGEPAEALMRMPGAYAVNVGGQRMIVTPLPLSPRTIRVTWDSPDGWRNEVLYRPINDLRPTDDLEQTALRVAASLRPASDDEWAAIVAQAGPNDAQRHPDTWLPAVLAANGLTQSGDLIIAGTIPPYLVPVTRSDGSTTICELNHRRLVQCHDTPITDQADMIDLQSVRVATSDPTVRTATVTYRGGDRIGTALTSSDDGINVAYVPVDPTRHAPDCLELVNADNQVLRTIPIGPATSCG